jgi:hypothetical protein
MIRKKTLLLVAVILLAAVCIAGCTVNVGAPAPTTVPITVQTVPPTTTAEPTTAPVTTNIVTTAIVTTAATTAPVGKEVLHETGILTTKTYKTYDFKTQMGYKFLYPKDKFKITIKSEKPVLGYAVNTEQAGQLQGSQLIPHYQTYLKGGIDWGLIEPVMVMEKATDSTKEFTIQDVGPLTNVVDGRWMSYDSSYDNTPPFTYEITIVKTGGPTEQNFDFAGLQNEALIVSKTKLPEPLTDSY